MKSLRDWRTERVMSVRDLAEAAGVWTKTVVQLEYGRQRAHYKCMRRIAGALGAGRLAVGFAQDPALPPGAFGAGVAALATAGAADDFVAGFHAATCD